jgi:hypothetical protein
MAVRAPRDPGMTRVPVLDERDSDGNRPDR